MRRRDHSLRIALLCAACTANLLLLTSQAIAQAPMSSKPALPPQPQGQAAAAGDAAEDASAREQTITVIGTETDGAQQIDRRSYTLGKDIQASTGSLADALRNLPSVQVSPQGQVLLRGNSHVTIYVDGKPAPMFNSQARGQILQQVPASQFDRIELMTNPSASVSAEGSGGIINLISKQKYNGDSSAAVQFNVGTRWRHNGGASLSKTFGKLGASADLGWRRDVVKGAVNDMRATPDPFSGDDVSGRQITAFRSTGTSWNGRAGLDYDVDAEDRLSTEGHFNTSDFLADNQNSYDGRDTAGAPLAVFNRDGATHYKRRSIGGSADWRNQLSGKDHTLSLHYGHDQDRNDETDNSTVSFQEPALGPYAEQVLTRSLENSDQLKLEYARPFSRKGESLLAGYELTAKSAGYDNITARGASVGTLVVIRSLTNRFEFQQTIHAGYITYQRPIGDLVVLLGLRAEDTTLRLMQVTSRQEGEQDYLRFFPSVHLQFKPRSGGQLSASYSRRIVRPTASQLNPFRIYLTPQNYQQGSLELLPELTDSFELGYEQRKGANFLQATLYRRLSTGGITDVIEDLDDGVLLTTKANLAKTHMYGLEMVQNWRLSSKFNLTFTGDFGHAEIAAPASVITGKRSAFIASGFASLTYQPTARDMLQISGFVAAKRLIPQGYHEPTGMLNLAYRHTFKNNIQFVATAQDVLSSFHDKLVIESPSLREVQDQHVSLRGFYIGLSYSLNRRPNQRSPAFDFKNNAPIPGIAR